MSARSSWIWTAQRAYGYLAGASRDSATRWPSDEQTVIPVQVFDIYVHPKWEGDKLTLEPFNAQNKEKFIKKLKDGLADVDDILIRPKAKCNLDVKSAKEVQLDEKSRRITSIDTNYETYKRVINSSRIEYLFYRENDNPIVIIVTYKNGKKYGIFISSCINGIDVSYYPRINLNSENENIIQFKVFEYQKQVEKLIDSFSA